MQILLALFLLALINISTGFAAADDAQPMPSPQPSDSTGPPPEASQTAAPTNQVATIDSFPLNDEKRDKTLVVRVTYPTDPGTYPVVIFSHGIGASKDSYQYLIDYWASHGYICIQPNHADTISTEGSDLDHARQMRKLYETMPSDYLAWANRFLDISFVIDSLPTIQSNLPVKLNMAKIAVAGHSFGAFTSEVVCGASEPEACRTQLTYTGDPRVTAAILISPPGVRRGEESFGFDDDKAWDRMTMPILFMTGSQDTSQNSDLADREAAFDHSPPGGKYFAMLDGANHMTFSDRAEMSQIPQGNGIIARTIRKRVDEAIPPEQGDHEALLASICRVSTDFLDAYLKDDQQALGALGSANEFGELTHVQNR